ncbi:hypothetical protein [Halovivax limisalsi]|uniref:hypothetical protein n=1 Tax=Halovivax limisalsi TaxID=1453760 RepID=UPI001FFD041C|nr:hypothetical protein [Halovivax limisalsi]
MSKSEWKQIKSNYDEYLRRYPEEGNVQGVLEYPLQSAAIIQGGYVVNTSSGLNQNLLITSDNSLPDIQQLSLETLAKLSTELMNILKVQISTDHQEYWKWTIQAFEKVNKQISILPSELVNNLEILFRLSACSPIPSQVGEGLLHPIQASWDSEGHEAYIIYRAKTIAAYLSFPLLEGVIKGVCSDYIKPNGEVKDGKRIKRFSGGYSNNVCYRLSDLLTHLEEEYADDEFKNLLRDMRIMIGDFYHRNPKKVYSLIGEWRNTSLHGQNPPDAEYGTIANIICLIIWNEIKSILR